MNTDELAKKLIEAMSADPRFRGPPGRDGRDGKTPEIDYDRLAAEMVKRLPPITFEIQENGRTVATQRTPLGGVVKLDLIPIR